MLNGAKKVLRIEAEAILALIDKINGEFAKAMEIILSCKGRVVVTGMGKSGLIGKKIAATLASTGTPALFLHPAEGIHGDLGMVMKGDVIIAISNSGETEEIVKLLPVFKRLTGPCDSNDRRDEVSPRKGRRSHDRRGRSRGGVSDGPGSDGFHDRDSCDGRRDGHYVT